jgi:16S rRNA (uracil1498-N3)-methyltransferase
MAARFYVNCPLGPGPVLVQGAEARHLAVVCRVRPGDLVCLFNGDGHEYPAHVTAAGRQGVALGVLRVETPERELGYPLVAAAPLPKGDRGQFLLEKLTELGVTAFVPLRTRRSVVHPGQTRREKLERYVIEASKQCGRNVLMAVGPLQEWAAFCRREDLPATRVVAHPCPQEGGRAIAWTSSGVVFAVGPEGGFTEEEIDQARAAGWRVLGLGPRTLRIETAALVLATRATGLS